MLGRAGGLAHRAGGRRKERRRGRSQCLCFVWKCPPQATRGQTRLEAVWPVHTHTQTNTHTHGPCAPQNCNRCHISRSHCFPPWPASAAIVHALRSSHMWPRPNAALPRAVFILRTVTLCRFSAGLVAAAVVSLTLSLTHTARSQRCLLTQKVLFIRQSDRDLWGARQRAHSKRRLCQASEDE